MRKYFLYDGRACGAQGTDNALCLSAGLTEQEARKDAEMFDQCACYSYEMVDKGDTLQLINERWEFDYWPNTGHVESANKNT